MAPNRLGRKRRLASLIVTAVLLASCGRPAEPEFGWSARQAVTSVEVSPTDVIVVSVALPPGYEAADDFVQRATLHSGEQSITVEQAGLSAAMRVVAPAAPESGEEAGLELLLGFCESTVKEVCYVDMPRLPVRYVAGGAGPGTVELTYRPEPPK